MPKYEIVFANIPYHRDIWDSGPMEQRACIVYRDDKKIAVFYEDCEKASDTKDRNPYEKFARAFVALAEKMDKEEG